MNSISSHSFILGHSLLDIGYFPISHFQHCLSKGEGGPERIEYPISNKECPISKEESICRTSSHSFILGHSLLDIGYFPISHFQHCLSKGEGGPERIEYPISNKECPISKEESIYGTSSLSFIEGFEVNID